MGRKYDVVLTKRQRRKLCVDGDFTLMRVPRKMNIALGAMAAMLQRAPWLLIDGALRAYYGVQYTGCLLMLKQPRDIKGQEVLDLH